MSNKLYHCSQYKSNLIFLFDLYGIVLDIKRKILETIIQQCHIRQQKNIYALNKDNNQIYAGKYVSGCTCCQNIHYNFSSNYKYCLKMIMNHDNIPLYSVTNIFPYEYYFLQKQEISNWWSGIEYYVYIFAGVNTYNMNDIKLVLFMEQIKNSISLKHIPKIITDLKNNLPMSVTGMKHLDIIIGAINNDKYIIYNP